MNDTDRIIRWGLWAAVVINAATPFLLWQAAGEWPTGYGAGNFSAAIMGVGIVVYLRRREGNSG